MQAMQTPRTLSTIVRAAQAGDTNAFDLLMQRFQGMAYAHAYSLLMDRDGIEDMVQEAFIEAYLALPSLREPDAFPAWFRRILLRQGERVIRRKHLPTVPLEGTPAFDIIEDNADPSVLAEERELQETVSKAIASLPEHERTTLLLFYHMNYGQKEIAELLGIPLGTVKKRLFDARKHLRGKLHYAMDAVRETLRVAQSAHEQHSSYLSAQVRLLIAVRLGDIEATRAMIEGEPMLLNGKMQGMHDRTLLRPVGYTALHEAVVHGHFALVQLLLDYGANVNASTHVGVTPLHDAVWNNHLALVTLLLAHHADANARLRNDLTPLHWAAMKNALSSVELLLDSGADVNVQVQSGRTPLHWASLKGHRELIRLLLIHGADATLRDETGRTAHDWARTRGFTMRM